MAGMLNDLLKKGRSSAFAEEKRRYARRACNELAEYVTESGKNIACKIVDMSLGGLRITSFNGIRKNDILLFNSPAMRAQVVWVEDRSAGLRFL